MSASIVQYKTGLAEKVASIDVTLDSSPTDGNYLLVLMGGGDNATSISSISQTGATWSSIRDQTGTGRAAGAWGAPNISSAGTTVTITFSSSKDYYTVTVLEISGLETSSVVDVSAGSSGTSGNYVTGDVTTTVANTFLVAVLDPTDLTNISGGPNNSFSTNNSVDGTHNEDSTVATREVTSTGTYNTTWTAASSKNYGTVLVALKVASSSSLEISQSEAVTIAEFAKPVVTPLVARPAESISVTEFDKLVVNPLAIHAGDDISVAEALTNIIALGIRATETISVSEFVKALLPELAIHSFDAVSVAEFEKLVVSPLAIHSADDITIAEFIKRVITPLTINSNDAISVAEFYKAAIPILLSVFDDVTVAEFAKVVLPQLAIHANDSLSVAEFIKLVPSPLTIHAADSVSLVDFTTQPLSPLLLASFETITALDNLRIGVNLGVRPSDAISLAEDVQAALALSGLKISVSEAIAIAENVVLSLNPLVASVFDNISVTDVATVVRSGGAAAALLQRQLQQHLLNQAMSVNWGDIKV